MAGQLRVDEITDEAGTGSPSFPQGIQPNSLGTGTPGAGNFLRGDGVWEAVPPGSTPGQLEILQEDIFTTSGTFTKATGYDPDDTVMIFLVGGGGSGGAVSLDNSIPDGLANGAGPGSCVVISARYADVPGTAFTLTAGAGGNAISSAAEGIGNNGGTSTLVNTSVYFYAEASGGTRGRGRRGANNDLTMIRFGDFDEITCCVVTNSFVGNIAALTASRSGQFSFQRTRETGGVLRHSVQGASAASNHHDPITTSTNDVSLMTTQVFASGGAAGRKGQTNRPAWNAPSRALFRTGGAGSGTANAQNATGIGGGGGGCARLNATATSGAGGSGGMIVRYYRGAVSFEQVLSCGE